MGKWILATENVPDIFETVLVTIRSKNGFGEPTNYVTMATYNRFLNSWQGLAGRIAPEESVVAWQYLPEPYENDKE